MLDKEKNRKIREADFNQWKDNLQKSVKEAGGK